MDNKIKRKYKSALLHKIKSEDILSQVVQEIARRKGFSEKEVVKFDADWASGSETVVKYDNCGEDNDLDIFIFERMSKEEIEKLFEINYEL